jgi:isopentenyl phosphate kinase
MAGLYLVKLGGSVITDIESPDTPKIKEIDRLLKEVKSSVGKRKIVLGHGVGSFAHVPAHKFMVHKGLINENSRKGASITLKSAMEIHLIMMERAVRIGLNAFSFNPSTASISEGKRITSWDIRPLEMALENDFLPITHGDVIMDSKQGVSIASTEEVFRYLASRLKPEKIIIGTDVDGVFSADPKLHRNAELISRIGRGNIEELLDQTGGSTKVDVTGGMRSKLEYLYNMSKETGAVCQIVNAGTKGTLQAALSGKEVKGTIIKA